MNKKLLFLTVIFAFITVAFATGQSTSSTINGRIVDEKGKALPGATVKVIHVPTGSIYGAAADMSGYYRIPNMNVGGPYKAEISFVGYEPFVKEGINLSLGQTMKLNVTLKLGAMTMAEVEVSGKRVRDFEVFDGNRTGAETVINAEQVAALPTVNRDITDFARLTPQATVGDEGWISIGGINNRYNQIAIDGAVNNDVFGLAASGTNGGQTGASPISMDIIEQFQVTLAPYDVRNSGFAGASINAVTKSGTNKFKGTAYYLNRNENLAGVTPTEVEDDREKLADFSVNTYGVSLGGSIIKNKLFFFANAEQSKEETPLPFSFSNYTGDSDQAKLSHLTDFMKSQYGYDPGTYLDKVKRVESTKLFAKLDWNINENNKLMLRHSYTKNVLDDAGASSSRSLGFSNNYYQMPSVTNSTALELKSFFDDYSNSLLVSGTFVRDDRDIKGDAFPTLRIYDGNGTLYLGPEAYSGANQLNQDILSITDNFQIYKGAHTVTVGFNGEFASVYNLFMRKTYGEYRFGSVDDFLNNATTSALQYERGYSLIDDLQEDGSAAAAELNVMQFGLYGQDEWQVNEDLKLTYGLRVDMPVFPTAPKVDDNFNNNTITELEGAGWNLQGAKAGEMPKPQLMFSPRIGFNWDLNGDQTTQLRGGVGIFTSRLPLVWPAGAYSNNGVSIGGVYYKSSAGNDIRFRADPYNQYKNSDFGYAEASHGGQVDLFASDFKYPQMFRANFAVDQKLPWGMVGTLEGIYSKTLNNMLYYNVNVDPDPDFVMAGADNRPHYDASALDDDYTRIMLGTNTNKGYTYNITAQVQKPFDNGLTASIAYTFGRSMSVNDATSSQNSSQWRYMENVNGLNDLDVSISDFDIGHRINGFLMYEVEFLDHLKSKFSLFYNGQSGRPFSYSYDDYGDMNGEGENAGNLIYIPAAQSEINLVDIVKDGVVTKSAAAQWAELEAFIDGEKSLSDHKGEYAERNGARTPFTHIFDFKFTQDVYVNVSDRKQTLQFTFDIFNLGNLLNNDWGRRYYVSNANYNLIDFKGFAADGKTPEFQFSAPNGDVWNVDDSGVNSSRWQAQIGVRYIF